MSFWLELTDSHCDSQYVEKPVRRGMESWPRTVIEAGNLPYSFLRRLRALVRREPDIMPVTRRHSAEDPTGTDTPPEHEASSGYRSTEHDGVSGYPSPVFFPPDQWGTRMIPQTLLYCDGRGLHFIRETAAQDSRLDPGRKQLDAGHNRRSTDDNQPDAGHNRRSTDDIQPDAGRRRRSTDGNQPDAGRRRLPTDSSKRDSGHYRRSPGRDQLMHHVFPYSRMQRIERGRVLLHSWLTIEHPSGAETFEFNSAAEPVLLPIIRRIRLKAFGVETPERNRRNDLDLRRFDPRIDLKFSNYARESLGNDEQVLTFSYLPDPPPDVRRLIILTDREVIEIREEAPTPPMSSSYGGVWSYMAV